MEARTIPALYQKRDGKWYCTLRGKQHYLGKNLDIAREKVRILLDDTPQRRPETIADLRDAYLESLSNNQSPDTIYTKRNILRAFAAFVGKRTAIRNVTADTIERYKQHCFAVGLCKQTVKSRMFAISALLGYAVKSKLIKANPMRQVVKVKVMVDPNPDYLTEYEEATLLTLTEGQRYRWLEKRDRLVFLVMLHAGLRRKESADLKWSDIDFERQLLVVRHGKGGKHRLVGLSATLLAALRDCHDRWKRSDVYVITTRSGRQICRESLWHVARKYIARLSHHYRGKRRFTLHSLRATFATRLCERGVSLRIVQALLGHTDPRTTMHYAAVSDAAIFDAAKRRG